MALRMNLFPSEAAHFMFATLLKVEYIVQKQPPEVFYEKRCS